MIIFQTHPNRKSLVLSVGLPFDYGKKQQKIRRFFIKRLGEPNNIMYNAASR
jgi:hypothetical protein